MVYRAQAMRTVLVILAGLLAVVVGVLMILFLSWMALGKDYWLLSGPLCALWGWLCGKDVGEYLA